MTEGEFCKNVINSKISGNAIKLLCYVLLNNKRCLNVANIKKDLDLSAEKLRKAETELEQHGIIKRNRIRINGRMRGIAFCYCGYCPLTEFSKFPKSTKSEKCPYYRVRNRIPAKVLVFPSGSAKCVS